MTGPSIYLIIEKGDPHDAGKIIELSGEAEVLLGRSSDNWRPDINFTSLCISRRHAVISSKGSRFYITDLMSKHGTTINGCNLDHNRPRTLIHGDRISLAGETVILLFNNPSVTGCDETVELVLTQVNDRPIMPEIAGLYVNPFRREVLLEGKPIYLAGKDIELLLLLHQNRQKAVSYNEIKRKIWPERAVDPVTGLPDVGSEEIKALVYRLRKRLGSYGNLITAVPRYGYMLDESNPAPSSKP